MAPLGPDEKQKRAIISKFIQCNDHLANLILKFLQLCENCHQSVHTKYFKTKPLSHNICTTCCSLKQYQNLIHNCARNGNVELIEFLLVFGKADVDKKNPINVTPLHWSCFQGHANATELLITKDAKINCHDICGFTPLHYACFRAHEEMIRLLLSHNANVDAPSLRIETPLFHLTKVLSQENQFSAIEVLCKNGADVNQRTDYGLSPLTLAKTNENRVLFKLLLKYSKNADESSSDVNSDGSSL